MAVVACRKPWLRFVSCDTTGDDVVEETSQGLTYVGNPEGEIMEGSVGENGTEKGKRLQFEVQGDCRQVQPGTTGALYLFLLARAVAPNLAETNHHREYTQFAYYLVLTYEDLPTETKALPH